ncbi:MAG: DUF4390 domain-containing protein [Thiohalospira sp.]
MLAAALCLTPLAAPGEPVATVERAESELEEGVWLLDADLRLVPSPTMREAVDNGARLELKATIEVYREQDWWPDESVAHLTQRYSLRYHPLTRRVVTTAHNSGDRRSYADLGNALRALGQLQPIPILDHALVDDCRRCYGRIRIELGVASVPLLHHPVHWFTNDWSLESPWFRWRIGT